MTSSAAQTQWNPINEDIENSDRRNADEAYETLAKKPLDLDGAKNALGGIWQVAPEAGQEIATAARKAEQSEVEGAEDILSSLNFNETDEAPSSEPDKVKTPAEQTQARIEARISEGSDDGGKIESRLASTQEREKNAAQAQNLFFSPENLSKQIATLGDESPEENQNWIDANIAPGGTLRKEFERIEGNFALPQRLDGKNLSEIYNKNPKDALLVNNALADAFELEIYSHTLKGKVNYPQEQVDALLHELQDKDTPPFQKLRIFWEIHTLVNTNVAKGGKKQADAFRKRTKTWQKAEQARHDFQKEQSQEMKKSEERVGLNENEDKPWDDTKPQWWEVFVAWDLDVAQTWSEDSTETA